MSKCSCVLVGVINGSVVGSSVAVFFLLLASVFKLLHLVDLPTLFASLIISLILGTIVGILVNYYYLANKYEDCPLILWI
jgi:ABC-type multidrug transport system permease subunit